MAAPSRSSASADSSHELDVLRSRAYGPDADIHRDVEALARLIELEEQARPDPLGAKSPGDRSAAEPGSSGERDGGPIRNRGGDDDGGEPADGEPAVADPAARPRVWARVPVFAWVMLALAIGIGIGVAVPVLSAPRPLVTLERAPIGDAPVDFELYGIRAESPVRYESFHDLQVWSGVSEQGSTCIVVTNDAGEWIAAGCAPEPLSPTADVIFFSGMRPIDGLDLPDGSVLRFTLREQVMDVWIAETTAGA